MGLGLKGDTEMTKQELVELIVENFTDKNGDIDISNMDFRTYNRNIIINGIKANGFISQCNHETDGHIFQTNHYVGASLYQDGHEVGGCIEQGRHKAGEEIHQGHHKAKGDIYQAGQETEGEIYQGYQKAIKVHQDESTKQSGRGSNADITMTKHFELLIYERLLDVLIEQGKLKEVQEVLGIIKMIKKQMRFGAGIMDKENI